MLFSLLLFYQSWEFQLKFFVFTVFQMKTLQIAFFCHKKRTEEHTKKWGSLISSCVSCFTCILPFFFSLCDAYCFVFLTLHSEHSSSYLCIDYFYVFFQILKMTKKLHSKINIFAREKKSKYSRKEKNEAKKKRWFGCFTV